MADAIKDGPEEQAENTEEVSKGGAAKKKILVISIIIAVQAIIVVGAGQFLIKPMLLPEIHGEIAVAEESPVGRGSIVVLENIIINLEGTNASRFLKVSVGVEVDTELVAAEVEDRRPELRDIVISSISGMQVADVVTAEGKDVIRGTLKERFAESLREGEPMNVFFSEFVVQ